MFGLVVAIDKPTSEKVVRRCSHLADIAGDPGGGVSHGRHFHFRNSLQALKGRRRRQTDLISIKMLWGHVWIVQRHSEKRSFRKNTFGFGPFDQRVQGGQYPVHFEGVRNPNIGDLPFGNVDQLHWKSNSLFFRTHGQKIFLSREEFFANLAFLDLATLSKLTWACVIAGSEGTRKSG